MTRESLQFWLTVMAFHTSLLDETSLYSCRYTHRKHAVLITAGMEMEMGKSAFNQARNFLEAI